MHTTRKGRFLLAIGSPRAVRFIFLGMLIYALVIGGLMLGYTNVQSCLADYSDDAARSSQTRTAAAAQDRNLNNRIEAVNTSDRQRIIVNQRAMRTLVEVILRGEPPVTAKALAAYNKVNDDSLEIYVRNEKERMAIAAERLKVEELRASAPAPEAPSDSC